MTEPTALGRYRIVKRLGEGGMGVVYLAHDDRLDRPVAIKMLRAGRNDGDARSRLWREARAAASVNHPAICQIYEIAEDGEALFLAMELLDGESLDDRLQRGPVPLAEAGQMALTVLAALEALHGRGIVHRDLKPSNVFLTSHGLKLLDFGLARPVHTDASETAITLEGNIIGTPRYMAPEQWKGQAVDARTDVFAAGALLFEMLTGKPAFSGVNAMEAYHAVLHEQPRALAGSGAVAAVDRVIHRALEKRPDDRYPTAEAMAQDLRAALALGPTESAEALCVRTTTRVIVLPFRMLRPDADIDFLSFSLPDAVAASLAGLESLVVRSMLAGAKYGAEAVDLKKVAAEAGVDAVVSGTLLRAGDQVRVNAQLVEAQAGTILWSKHVQVALRDIFELQDELVRAIVESLAIPLSSREQRQLQRDMPANARAYEFYLRANQLSHEVPMLPVARDLYRSALDDDPNYAPAWAKLGRVYRVLAKYGKDEGEADYRRAEDAFRRAFAISPDLGLAHNLYTNFEVEQLGRPVPAMVRLLERAHTHTTDPDLFAGLVLACRYCGLLEASIAADRQARRLDPAIRTSIMYTHFMLGDWERAIASDNEDAHFITKYTLPLVGREGDAIAAFRDAEIRPLPFRMLNIMKSTRAAVERRRDECLEGSGPFMHPDETFDPEGMFFVGCNFARVGEVDHALRTLEWIVERGFSCPRAFLHHPWLEPLHTDSRFAALVERAETRARDAERQFQAAAGERVLGRLPES